MLAGKINKGNLYSKPRKKLVKGIIQPGSTRWLPMIFISETEVHGKLCHTQKGGSVMFLPLCLKLHRSGDHNDHRVGSSAVQSSLRLWGLGHAHAWQKENGFPPVCSVLLSIILKIIDVNNITPISYSYQVLGTRKILSLKYIHE